MCMGRFGAKEFAPLSSAKNTHAGSIAKQVLFPPLRAARLLQAIFPQISNSRQTSRAHELYEFQSEKSSQKTLSRCRVREDNVFNVSRGVAGRSRACIFSIHERRLFIRRMHTGRGWRESRLVVATLAWCAAVAIPAVPETRTPQMSSMGFVLSEGCASGPRCSRRPGGRTLACR